MDEIMIGQTIDRFRVVEQLGQGGMGVVYKARDTTLDRFVALKFLPPDKSFDPDRRRRFLHEAKAASALNHPGIVAVYDVLEHDGRDVLVMELVEGETLESLISRKKLPLGEALGHAVGIADALARAHAAGIVHRDLKPSNVMVTTDGVKVLDFGLAKLVDSPYPDPEAPTVASDESAMTRERVVMGTVGWMSPEQASGEPVDARSDVFSFGVILYEMLTGRHPFRRGSTIETMAAIRDEDPEPLRQLAPSLPPEAERAALRCLHKDPSRRWQSLSDLGAVLADLKQDTESGRRVIAEAVPRRTKMKPAIFAIAVAVAFAAIVAALVILRPERAAPAPLAPERLTYDAGASITPAISPDGNLIAFVSDRDGSSGFDIWVRHLKQTEPTRLTDHPADDWHPAFSPDGSKIIFKSQRDGGGIYVVNALGGGLRRLAGAGLFPRFSPDGSEFVFGEDPAWSTTYLRRMFTAPASGGQPEPLAPGWGVRSPPNSVGPVFSPDGRYILFAGAPLDNPRQDDWWVVPLDGREPWSSGAREAGVMFDVVDFPTNWLPGEVLFIAGTTIEGMNLYRADISDEGRISGPIQPLTVGPGMTWTPSVADDHRLAFSRFSWTLHLWEVALDTTDGTPVAEPRRITGDAAPKFTFALTPNGNRLAYSTFSGPRGDRRSAIVLQNRTSGEESVPLTLSEANLSLNPRMSADGSLFSWRQRTGGEWVSSVAKIDDPAGREICRNCLVVDFFSDGQHVLVDRGPQLSRLRIDDGAETPILEVKARALFGSDLSHDDGWLALQIGESNGTMSIYAVPILNPMPPPEEWVVITQSDRWVGSPRWSVDGRKIYFISERDDFLCIWGAVLDPQTKIPLGEPFPVAHAHTTAIKLMPFAKHVWTIEVGGDRLVFNAGEVTGDVYTAMLETD